jgi:F-type H+-transporting ATPase subunit c
MKRIGTWTCIVLMVLLAAPLPAWAQEKASTGSAATKPAGQEAAAAPEASVGRGLMVMGACIGAALAAAFGGMAIARIATACLESTARQPEAAGQLFSPMIITAAMVEGCILFAIVIALMGIMK